MNRSEPQKGSRGHSRGSKWLKSSLKYSLHVITATEPTFHSKIPLISVHHEHWGWGSPIYGDFGRKSDFKNVNNEVKQQKVGIT